MTYRHEAGTASDRSRGDSGASVLRVTLTVLALVLAVLCVGLPIAVQSDAGILPASWTEADRADEVDIEVTAATRRAVTVFLNADYRTIDTQIENVLAASTGTFREEFDNRKVQYAALAREGKAVTEGTVREVALNRADENEALVSVAADSVVENEAIRALQRKGKKVDTVRPYFFQITMTRVGEKWLISNLEIIG